MKHPTPHICQVQPRGGGPYLGAVQLHWLQLNNDYFFGYILLGVDFRISIRCGQKMAENGRNLSKNVQNWSEVVGICLDPTRVGPRRNPTYPTFLTENV